MKAFLLVLVLACTAYASVPENERVNGDNGWYVPKIDGTQFWVDKDVGQKLMRDMDHATSWWFGMDKNPVKFYLLTNKNPTDFQEITLTEESIKNSNFDPSLPTKFSIHGWRQAYTSSMNVDIALAWFQKGGYNIIVPDWSRARDLIYYSSASAVPGVGKKVAKLIDFLSANFNLDLSHLEVIGHSLGSHVSGFAGKNVKDGKINTIVALDPALPLFDYDDPSTRLCSTDAQYVQTIHTCGGKLGFLKPIGTSNFYPNGGINQPGCGLDFLGMCDHARSVYYYVEAVLFDNFASIKCNDYENAVNDKCGTTDSPDRMGAVLQQYRVNGNFYVPVNSEYPYGTLPL